METLADFNRLGENFNSHRLNWNISQGFYKPKGFAMRDDAKTTWACSLIVEFLKYLNGYGILFLSQQLKSAATFDRILAEGAGRIDQDIGINESHWVVHIESGC